MSRLIPKLKLIKIKLLHIKDDTLGENSCVSADD